jgi:uncharacterized protein YjbJ (UPF0337 family)
MSDQVDGLAREGLGKAQDAAGAVLGDPILQAKGKLNEAAGTVQRRFGEAKDQVRGAVSQARDRLDHVSDLEDFVREQPLLGIALGVGLGFVLAAFLLGGRGKTIYVNTPPKH